MLCVLAELIRIANRGFRVANTNDDNEKLVKMRKIRYTFINSNYSNDFGVKITRCDFLDNFINNIVTIRHCKENSIVRHLLLVLYSKVRITEIVTYRLLGSITHHIAVVASVV